jgi:hypothetical protein
LIVFVKRDRAELEREFKEAFLRLTTAGRNFDEGHGYEAAAVASAVYVFVHEGGKRSPSLLTLLDLKSGLLFVDSASPLNPRNYFTETPLVLMEVRSEGFTYKAIRDQGPPLNLPPLRFGKWWEKPVLRDRKRRAFSRKNLIHFFRHFRGGGHAGRQHEPQGELPAQAFSDMSLGDPGNWIFVNNGRELVPEYGADYASVRQIGWELEQTLRGHCGELIPAEVVLNKMRPVASQGAGRPDGERKP